MFQPFVRSNLNLSRQSVAVTENRCAHYRREFGVNQHLPAHNHKWPVTFGVVSKPLDTVQLSSFHGSSLARLFHRHLVLHGICGFGIEPVGCRIDSFQIAGAHGCTRAFEQVLAKHAFDEG